MRIAVLSDIHGFSLALDAVLADIEGAGPFAAVVVAGDLCEGGPDPAGVLTRLRGREQDQDLAFVQGNTDRDLVLAADDPWSSPEPAYTLAEIGAAGVAFLASLPLTRRYTPPGGDSPVDDLLVCHANPHDLDRKLHPEMTDRELREVLGDTVAAAVAFGHHHVAYVRNLAGTLLVDVSAVGNPKDGDLRAKYGIVGWDAGERRWNAEIRRLPYPLETTAEQMLASGMPNPEKALRKLERASYRRQAAP